MVSMEVPINGRMDKEDVMCIYMHMYVLCLVAQSCLTLCDPMDCSLLGSSLHEISQARILPFPSPGDLPNAEIESRSPALQVDSLPAEPQGKPSWQRESQVTWQFCSLVVSLPSISAVNQKPPPEARRSLICGHEVPQGLQLCFQDP